MSAPGSEATPPAAVQVPCATRWYAAPDVPVPLPATGLGPGPGPFHVSTRVGISAAAVG